MSSYPFSFTLPNPAYPWKLWPSNFGQLPTVQEVEGENIADTADQCPADINQDERFKALIAMIEHEFEIRKAAFKGFTTERQVSQSTEFHESLCALKYEISCWTDRLQNLPWLEEYFTSYLIDLWRHLATPASSDVRMLDSTEPPTQPDMPEEKIFLPPSELSTTAPVPNIPLALERANFVLMCTQPNGTRMVVPDLELAATSCLAEPHAIAAHAHNYSWDVFQHKFECLLNEKNEGEPIPLSSGTISYAHPDDPMRVISNQENFAVAINYATLAPGNRIYFNFSYERQATPAAPSTGEWCGLPIIPGIRHQSIGSSISRLPVLKARASSRRGDILVPSNYKPGSIIRRPGVRSGISVPGKIPTRAKARTTRAGFDRLRGKVVKEISHIRTS